MKKSKETAKIVFNNNTHEFNIRKAIEEFTELSLILIQYLNKPHKVKSSSIIMEAADAQIRLWYIITYFGAKKVKKRIKYKLKQLLKNVYTR